jgi:hypothetical protein
MTSDFTNNIYYQNLLNLSKDVMSKDRINLNPLKETRVVQKKIELQENKCLFNTPEKKLIFNNDSTLPRIDENVEFEDKCNSHDTIDSDLIKLVNCKATKSEISSSSSEYDKESIKKSSYIKFGLNIRETPKHLCSSKKITHKLLPLKEKNNSKYKKKLILFLKRQQYGISKTASCRQPLFYKVSRNTQGNMMNMVKQKVGLESNMKSYSTAKVNSNRNLELTDKGNTLHSFCVYKEKEIGFSIEWQRNLKFTEMDDDIETDVDQLEAACRHCKKEVKESELIFLDNQNKIRNTQRFKEITKQEEIFKLEDY